MAAVREEAHHDVKVKSATLNLPIYKNWYEEGYVTKPLNQGSCGGCWAFSSSSATESLAYISGLDKELTDYSVQQLIDCDTANYACDGGWMYEGFQYISKHGILKRDDYEPYAYRKSFCHIKEKELDEKKHLWKIGY